eukprot:271929-Prorocentrum_minimum.AAC.1
MAAAGGGAGLSDFEKMSGSAVIKSAAAEEKKQKIEQAKAAEARLVLAAARDWARMVRNRAPERTELTTPRRGCVARTATRTEQRRGIARSSGELRERFRSKFEELLLVRKETRSMSYLLRCVLVCSLVVFGGYLLWRGSIRTPFSLKRARVCRFKRFSPLRLSS